MPSQLPMMMLADFSVDMATLVKAVLWLMAIGGSWLLYITRNDKT